MPVTTEKYDQLKIDKLRHLLTDLAAKGQGRPYEIFVDGLKVVPKTEDPKEFDNYEYYINEDTEKIRILIYYSLSSPRNDQYCYYIQNSKTENSFPLQGSPRGLGELEGILQEKLEARDREHELKRLTEQLTELKQQLQEAEDYCEELEEQLSLAKNNKHKLGKMDLVELGGLMLERLAVKNADALEKIGLAGLVQPTPGTTQATPQATEASFQRKNKTSEEDQQLMKYLAVLTKLDNSLEKEDKAIVMAIIDQLILMPTYLKPVAELLNIQTPDS